MHQAGRWFKSKLEQNSLASRFADNLIKHMATSNHAQPLSDADRSFLVERYFPSLIRLKIAFWETGNSAYEKIYLDERLRYAPHRSSFAERREFFKGLLDSEERILSSLDAGGSTSAEFLRINQPLVKDAPDRSVTVLAIGDCLLNEVRAFLPDLKDGTLTDVRCIYFSANQSKGLDMSEVFSFLDTHQVDLIAMSFLSYEALPGYSRLVQYAGKMTKSEIESASDNFIKTISKFIFELREKTDKTMLLHGVSGLPLHRYRKHLSILNPLSKQQRYLIKYLDSKLRELALATENCLFIDEKSIAEQYGYRYVSREIAPQRKFGGMFHTTWLGKHLAEQSYYPVIEAFDKLSACKLLLVDFDNTLWAGVMADGDVDHYYHRQKLLGRLKDTGIVLVALSKNSPENIRWSEMELKEEDFALLKINWNTKAQSVKEVADTLNLNVKNFILLDDSPQERALMTSEIPEIVCLDAQDDSTWQALEWLFDFPNTQETEEAKLRTRMYQQQAQREGAMTAEVDYPSMMRSLGLWYRVGECSEKQLDRVVELINRTNQFNTTTIRYSKAKVKEFMAEEKSHVLFGEMGDKFGSLGIVAVIILIEQYSAEGEPEVLIDSFIMSCRAMGFNFEHELLSCVEDRARDLGKTGLIGRYVPSERNNPCSKVFEQVGFIAQDDHLWAIRLDDGKKISRIDWFSDK